MIIPVLQFLETCDLVNANELWESVLKYLTYAPDVQKAAWKFLFAKRKNKLKNYKYLGLLKYFYNSAFWNNDMRI